VKKRRKGRGERKGKGRWEEKGRRQEWREGIITNIELNIKSTALGHFRSWLYKGVQHVKTANVVSGVQPILHCLVFFCEFVRRQQTVQHLDMSKSCRFVAGFTFSSVLVDNMLEICWGLLICSKNQSKQSFSCDWPKTTTMFWGVDLPLPFLAFSLNPFLPILPFLPLSIPFPHSFYCRQIQLLSFPAGPREAANTFWRILAS